MIKTIDINTWPRKDHFNFFRQFEEPFFGVCININCTRAYETCKQNGYSFFLYYLYASLKAANSTEPFRYRIAGDKILHYESVNASPTINRPDGTFGFGYMDYKESFSEFMNMAEIEIEKVRNSPGLVPAITGENVIHYSSIPWINFTSLSHARSFSFKDCIPKISFGKMTENNGIKSMPVSVHVHHGLMDGYHVGQFIDRFQELMNEDDL
ncbi:MAG: chloramphenicol acetyltransferase [Bacteroidetes bacterium]|nr:chloramphenicol acetyltransferase [Bacteroidota bacterium]